MKRLIHLLLFTTWFIGAVTGGVTVGPDASDETARVVSDTGLAILAVNDNQVVLTVAVSEHTRWQFAAPAPPFLTDWLRESAPASFQRTTPNQTSTPVAPSFIVSTFLHP